jgi:hypothetical protein
MHKDKIRQAKLSIISAVLLPMIISASCSLFTRGETATPTPDYIFEPITTPLKVEPDSLPNAQTGVAYEVEIRVSDNVTPVSSVFISSGTLPAGLELVFVDGEDAAKIGGVPEETGTFTFKVLVSCFGTMVSGQTLEKDFQIVVEK